MTEIFCKELSYKVMGLAFNIHRKLGPGLLESVYEKAFCVELEHSGVPFSSQHNFPVYYRDTLIGNYVADLVVDNSIILELKAVKEMNKVMEAQIINYLKISGIPVGYLINFNSLRLSWKRFVSKRE